MARELIIRRYTDVTSLIHILTHKKITLLDPKMWDDKNDSEFMNIYKEKENIKSILALCFTRAPETYHHWKIFSPGNSGVCIRFRKNMLLKDIDVIENNQEQKVIHKDVVYRTIERLEKTSPNIKDLPFLKRYPFRDEKEYRIIFTSKKDSNDSKALQINLDSISAIVLSPWIHISLVEPLKKAIQSIEGCEEIKIFKTTVNENDKWISSGKKAT